MPLLPPLQRRTVLTLLSGAALAPGSAVMAKTRPISRVADTTIAIEFDGELNCRVAHRSAGGWHNLTGFDRSESLHLEGGKLAGPFHFETLRQEPVRDAHGEG